MECEMCPPLFSHPFSFCKWNWQKAAKYLRGVRICSSSDQSPIKNIDHFLENVENFINFPFLKSTNHPMTVWKNVQNNSLRATATKKNWKPTFHLPWKNRRKEGSTFNLILIFQLYNFLNKPNNELFENGLFNASFFLHETFAIQFNYIASWNLECFNLSKIVSMSEQRRQSPSPSLFETEEISVNMPKFLMPPKIL